VWHGRGEYEDEGAVGEYGVRGEVNEWRRRG
jgi:hypothetical protein